MIWRLRGTFYTKSSLGSGDICRDLVKGKTSRNFGFLNKFLPGARGSLLCATVNKKLKQL